MLVPLSRRQSGGPPFSGERDGKTGVEWSDGVALDTRREGGREIMDKGGGGRKDNMRGERGSWRDAQKVTTHRKVEWWQERERQVEQMWTSTRWRGIGQNNKKGDSGKTDPPSVTHLETEDTQAQERTRVWLHQSYWRNAEAVSTNQYNSKAFKEFQSNPALPSTGLTLDVHPLIKMSSIFRTFAFKANHWNGDMMCWDKHLQYVQILSRLFPLEPRRAVFSRALRLHSGVSLTVASSQPQENPLITRSHFLCSLALQWQKDVDAFWGLPGQLFTVSSPTCRGRLPSAMMDVSLAPKCAELLPAIVPTALGPT